MAKNCKIDEIMLAILERDSSDLIVDMKNRPKLIDLGFKMHKPKKVIKINTGEVDSIENVIKIICDNLKDEHRIISMVGQCGAGKSSTFEALKTNLNAFHISMGDIFRFLTYSEIVENKKPQMVLRKMNYSLIDGNNRLCIKELDILKEFCLYNLELEKHIPDVSTKTQHMVIEFVKKEITELSKHKKRILIEGRDFTLDFIPSDLRINLFADPLVRARRRFLQRQEKIDE
ncbi:TPA: hypothetical protein DD449_05350 [Candidatus Berkelbacteria bacterium]|nr:hypothetical protein [Candidatus Berkelbacteria bacterium]